MQAQLLCLPSYLQAPSPKSQAGDRLMSLISAENQTPGTDALISARSEAVPCVADQRSR